MRTSPTLLLFILLFTGFAATSTAQNTCGTAVALTPASLPYTQTGLSTCGTVNDYSTTDPGCSHADMGGEDYVLSYTPTSDECIDINVTNGNSSGGLFLMDDCPDVATSDCVDRATSSGTSRSLVNMPVESGITYYIIVSCNSSCGCMTFDLNIVVSAASTTGHNCCTPETLTLPYSATSQTTCGFVDDYTDTEICSSLTSHLGEEERAFIYTSPGSECVAFAFTNVSTVSTDLPDIGVAFLQNCPVSPNANCFASTEADNVAAAGYTGFVPVATAGTYIVMVGGDNTSDNCFSYDLGVTSSPLATVGADCASPVIIGALPYSSSQTTCCMQDDYATTDACTSNYMEGQDIVFTYTAAGAECIQLTISNTDGSSDVGAFILDGCPDAGATCLATGEETNGGPTIEATLPGAGTYYIVVATDDDGECTTFDIDVEAIPTTGSDCASAIAIGAFPYSISTTTCCKGDDYSSSDACTSSYMNGNEMVYTFTLGTAACITATIADNSVIESAEFGLFLMDACPDAGATCLAEETVLNGSSERDGVTLQYTAAAGSYHLVVSSDSDPQCSTYDLTVTTATDGTAAGSTCGNPTAIPGAGPFPYSSAGNTTFCFGDDYATTDACLSSYMEGDDYIYTFNPTATDCYLFQLSNTEASAGLHLLDGCPNAGATCLGSDNGTSATVSGNLTSGTTYYIVVSSDGTPQFIDFDLSVTQVTAGSTGSTCATAQSIGALPYTSTGLSTYCFGDDYTTTDACTSAYMEGDDFVFSYTPGSDICVDIALTGTNSSAGLFLLDECPDAGTVNCLASDVGSNPSVGTTLTSGITYYIVVSSDGTPQGTSFDIAVTELSTGTGSDFCTDPADLSASPIVYSGEESSGTFTADEYVAAPDGLIGVFCGSIENNQWYRFIASATTAVFNFTTYGAGGGVQAEAYSTDGCCSNFTSVSNCWNPATAANGTVTATGLTIGSIYLLMVDGFAGAVHTFDLDVASGVGTLPLPVDLLYFTGENHGRYNELRWETASELNSDFFTLERSTGNGVWSPIASMKASGMSDERQSYMARDEDPMFGTNYYRLITTDYDGTEEHSEMIAIDVINSRHQMVVTQLMPNPTDNMVNIGMNSMVNGMVNVDLVDMTGRLVKSESWNVEAGTNTLSMDVSDQPGGIYYVAVRNEANLVSMTKLVKN